MELGQKINCVKKSYGPVIVAVSMLFLLLLVSPRHPSNSISLSIKPEDAYQSLIVAEDYPEQFFFQSEIQSLWPKVTVGKKTQLLATAGPQYESRGFSILLEREDDQWLITVTGQGLSETSFGLNKQTHDLVVIIGSYKQLPRQIKKPENAFSELTKQSPLGSDGLDRQLSIASYDFNGRLQDLHNTEVNRQVPLVNGIECPKSCEVVVVTSPREVSQATFVNALRILSVILLLFFLLLRRRSLQMATLRSKPSPYQLPRFTMSLTVVLLLFAALVLPNFDDDGSVIAIARTMLTANNASNYYSVSASYMPVGWLSAGFWKTAVGISSSWLWLRFVLLALIVFSYWIGTSVLRKVVLGQKEFYSAVRFFSAFFLIMSLAFAFTLRFESLLLPISALLIYSVIGQSEDKVIGFPGVTAFLAFLSLSISQTGIALVFSVCVLVLLRWREYRHHLISMASGGILALTVLAWNSSIQETIQRYRRFASLSSFHNLGLADELQRYLSGLTQSPLRRIATLFILLSIPLIVGAASKLKQRETKAAADFRAEVILILALMSSVGLVFTSSKWSWHFTLLAVTLPIAVAVKGVQTQRLGLLNEKSSIATVMVLVFGVFASGASSQYLGTTPALSDVDHQNHYLNLLRFFPEVAFGPIPLVLVTLCIVIVYLPTGNRQLSVAKSVFVASALISSMTVIPLVTEGFENRSINPTALPLRELISGNNCGVADNIRVPSMFVINNERITMIGLTELLERRQLSMQITQTETTVGLMESDVVAVFQDQNTELVLTHSGASEKFVFPSSNFATWHLLTRELIDYKHGIVVEVKIPPGVLISEKFLSTSSSSVSEISSQHRMVVDPVFYPLSTCIDPPRILRGFFEEVPFIFGRPDVTDLGQIQSLDVGWKFASGRDLVNFGCHPNESTLSYYCLYGRITSTFREG